MSEEKIINSHLKCYLIVAMESTGAKDEGRGWRDRLRPELISRVDSNGNHLYVFDPTLHEEKKVGMCTKEFHKKLGDWLSSGQRDKIKEGMDFIWRGKSFLKPDEKGGEDELVHVLGDIDYVRNSDFIILHIGENDRPCGTYAEAFLAYERKIPIYLIQTMALNKYNKSLLGWVLGSNGDIFPNQKQLIEFLDKKYNLKVKKTP